MLKECLVTAILHVLRIAAGVMFVVVGFQLIANEGGCAELSSAEDEHRDRILSCVDAVLNGVEEDEWWLLTLPGKYEQTVYEHHIKKVETAKKRCETLLKEYSAVTQKTAELSQWVNTFVPSVYYQGVSMFIGYPQETCIDALGPHEGLELCFLSKADSWLHHAHVYFLPEWRALLMPGIEWESDALLAGIMYHELLHGFLDEGRVIQQNIDDYLAEEVKAHELETVVMNSATNGALLTFIDALSEQYRDERLSKRLSYITPEDIEIYFEIIKATHAGMVEKSLALAQFYMMVGCRMIDREEKDAGRALARKEKLSLWLTQSFNRLW